MKYVAAYVLLKLAENDNPSLEDVKNVILASDGEFDEKLGRMVIDKLAGKDLSQLIQQGRSKLCAFAPPSAAATPQSVTSTTAQDKSAPKAKEPEPEPEEEDDDVGLGGLFD